MAKNKFGGENDAWFLGKISEWSDWQRSLYHTWHQHGCAIHGVSTSPYMNQVYSGVYFDPDFYSFANFYNYCVENVVTEEFKKNPSAYVFDKDSLGGKWAKGSIKLMTKADSARDARIRNPRHVGARRQRLRVTYENGSVKDFISMASFAEDIGVHRITVNGWVKGYSSGYKKMGVTNIDML